MSKKYVCKNVFPKPRSFRIDTIEHEGGKFDIHVELLLDKDIIDVVQSGTYTPQQIIDNCRISATETMLIDGMRRTNIQSSKALELQEMDIIEDMALFGLCELLERYKVYC